ncbi:hypothetical protein C464_06060 [Halorubrum coriense DSM 10284]|uniref:Uncharacterized protein n=1 Tax=Halorubrum coriense DSM 10284 TaxID=1227466 RepID=M0EPY2_9EURY|nr:hypothetical protein [Halorubrum coriense]ELZ48952.1 hypothetical protein C464_06060 [Halorubrum coriense DSM 10284]QRG24158.1 hypothetical protein HrrHm1_235 [Halorubrum virus Humcor1]
MNLDVPDKYEDWPFEARAFVLAEANTAADLRQEIDSLAGMEHDPDAEAQQQFTNDELAQLVMALGGPQESDGL